MKAKTNLELFYNEIEWTIKHSDKTAYYALYRTLFDIYYRETGELKIIKDTEEYNSYKEMLLSKILYVFFF